MRNEILGKKDFRGSVDITDPCYRREVWCRMNDVKIAPGEYTCMVYYEQESYEYRGKTETYEIVSEIGIYLDGVVPAQESMECIGEIGVDAGLAGFFHKKPDFTDAKWSQFCDQIRRGKAWLTDLGFFSSSGGGDGEYSVYAAKAAGEITALVIRFCEDEQEDEEDDELDDEES